MRMNTAPLDVANSDGDTYRFINTCGRRAAIIVVQGIGWQYPTKYHIRWRSARTSTGTDVAGQWRTSRLGYAGRHATSQLLLGAVPKRHPPWRHALEALPAQFARRYTYVSVNAARRPCIAGSRTMQCLREAVRS
jgi:hypothetical protein